MHLVLYLFCPVIFPVITILKKIQLFKKDLIIAHNFEGLPPKKPLENKKSLMQIRHLLGTADQVCPSFLLRGWGYSGDFPKMVHRLPLTSSSNLVLLLVRQPLRMMEVDSGGARASRAQLEPWGWELQLDFDPTDSVGMRLYLWWALRSISIHEPPPWCQAVEEKLNLGRQRSREASFLLVP